ncbi:hypothetical protein LEP1GSC021_1511 [Leptospira noguchii str. 1993005606]|nr:hypothetical protein LEP1GSC021_1511 [Leptospira noguchii str. 1993005606]
MNSAQRFPTITNPTSIWISILNLWELRKILCKTEFPTRPIGKRCALVSNAIHRERFAEFNFDSKILFNLWGWLWLPMGRRSGSRCT